ncbi:hypothetical protein A4X06_0g2612 [Tilletia controversa]|uniref:Uncharacterized protein n=2 Tax=Tilletia TaxID=13289 RepID=A0A8X7MX96_9BASI|nr:hypothetical protein CF336_g3511 [Tilletia laevis]KAE8199353.1 hypothetical protein CF328_g3274 [Tilletia controversa]KAE8204119.1 hypothetical protein CF335_g2770 [Tilletia laevis]KAE8251609.1 hypothetical protein A4X06_0g2612 [Tilletia controversa]KAE8261860.1 hypothetical protein A4X03_0g2913 [Tilletia caries]
MPFLPDCGSAIRYSQRPRRTISSSSTGVFQYSSRGVRNARKHYQRLMTELREAGYPNWVNRPQATEDLRRIRQMLIDARQSQEAMRATFQEIMREEQRLAAIGNANP